MRKARLCTRISPGCTSRGHSGTLKMCGYLADRTIRARTAEVHACGPCAGEADNLRLTSPIDMLSAA